MIDSKTAYSVSNLNKYIKQMFDNNFTLRGVTVKGEISNFKHYPSGHVYFSLKDEESTIKGVMFYEYASHLDASITDGVEVLAYGKVSVYPARGEYQLYVEAMEPYGAGAQLLEFEMLKKKLASEGLFDASRKRKINIFPKAIGVISAPNSAALADIKTNILRRNPLVEVKIFPSLVQGSEAPKSLLKALNDAKNANLDTLIIGRGGGASEDLSAFNDETLVRAAAEFPVPIISAVGHEIDFTLIDYVADARASTPTGAAELATIDKREIYQKLDNSLTRITNSIEKRLERIKDKINSVKNRPFFINPKSMYEDKLIELTNTKDKLNILVSHILDMKKQAVSSRASHLKALSPDGVINRGYSIMQDENGKVVKSTKDVAINQKIKTVLSDGVITSTVVGKEKNHA